ncbi:MAG: ATP-dependent sacrificial sulfur transferase LarE [Planctomycetota bacterium]|nr:ATP-dependent sacrificial sulfur transferase LarE [Planctomycetota bacterium]
MNPQPLPGLNQEAYADSGNLISGLAEQLVRSIAGLEPCAVAFSGGVDSSVVAKAAWLALGDRSVAVTGIGAAVSEIDLQWAREVTNVIGIRHVQIPTAEIDDPDYLRNDTKRCYFCKSHLYKSATQWGNEHGFRHVLSGTNWDDLSDYRPGLVAAAEHAVIAPLADLKIGKAKVRQLAEYWQLPVAHRPASPCLASRIAYGQSVSKERLKRIESAEAWLHQQGFHDVRVRLHADELARVELADSELIRLLDSSCRDAINHALREMGFRYVTIDLGGRQSGSMNRSIPNQTSANPTSLRQSLPVLQ